MYIILIGFQVSAWAMPHKNDIIAYLNFHFPPKPTKDLTLSQLILDVNRHFSEWLSTEFTSEEATFRLEASLESFGLCFYTDEYQKTLCGVVNIDKFYKFVRARSLRKIKTSDIVSAMSVAFCLKNHVSKDNKTYIPEAVDFYKCLDDYFGSFFTDETHGYLGGPYLKGKNLTVYYKPLESESNVLILPGVPMPPKTLGNNIRIFNNQLTPDPTIAGSYFSPIQDITGDDVSSSTFQFDEKSQSSLVQDNPEDDVSDLKLNDFPVIKTMYTQAPLSAKFIKDVKGEFKNSVNKYIIDGIFNFFEPYPESINDFEEDL